MNKCWSWSSCEYQVLSCDIKLAGVLKLRKVYDSLLRVYSVNWQLESQTVMSVTLRVCKVIRERRTHGGDVFLRARQTVTSTTECDYTFTYLTQKQRDCTLFVGRSLQWLFSGEFNKHCRSKKLCFIANQINMFNCI